MKNDKNFHSNLLLVYLAKPILLTRTSQSPTVTSYYPGAGLFTKSLFNSNLDVLSFPIT